MNPLNGIKLKKEESLITIKDKYIKHQILSLDNSFSSNNSKLDDISSNRSKKLAPIDNKNKTLINNLSNILLGKTKHNESFKSSKKELPKITSPGIKLLQNQYSNEEDKSIKNKSLINFNLDESILVKKQIESENAFDTLIKNQLEEDYHEISLFLSNLGLEEYIENFIKYKYLTIDSLVGKIILLIYITHRL